MATSAQTIAYLLDQLPQDGSISTKKMFGEYCLYMDGKPVAFVCDDQLFIKPTAAGRALIDPLVEAPAYPGSKMYYLIGADRWEARDWLAQLVRTTADALPAPKPKKPKQVAVTTGRKVSGS